MNPCQFCSVKEANNYDRDKIAKPYSISTQNMELFQRISSMNEYGHQRIMAINTVMALFDSVLVQNTERILAFHTIAVRGTVNGIEAICQSVAELND
jgi:hypothetical protein